MTPEEQEELDRLLAAGARYGAPSMHVDDVDLLSGSLASSQDAMAPPLPPMEGPRQAPPPPEALAPIPPSAAPQGPAQPPPQAFELPPPIPLPERGDPHAGGTRGGRIVHGILGALGQAATGRNMYTERLARERATADDQYARDVDRYNRANAMRGQQVKEGRLMAPIGEELASTFGLDPSMPAYQFEQWRNAGGGSMVREQQQHARDREEFLSDREYDQQIEEARRNQDFERERELLAMKLAAQKKRKGGGSARAAAAGVASGVDPALREQGLDDIAAGQFDTRAARAVLMSASNKDEKRIIDEFIKVGKVARTDIEGSEKELQRHYSETADQRAGLASWNAWKSEHQGDLKRLINEVSGKPYGNWSDEAKQMMNTLRVPVASFLREMAGAAMSPSEAGLHGGPAARLLVEQASSGISADALAAKIEDYFRRGTVTPGDLLSLVARVENTVKGKQAAAVRAAPTAALSALPDDDRMEAMQQRIVAAVNSGSLSIPEGTKIDPDTVRLDGHRIRFKYLNGEEGEVK